MCNISIFGSALESAANNKGPPKYCLQQNRPLVLSHIKVAQGKTNLEDRKQIEKIYRRRGWGLTTKRHKETFGGNGETLYLYWDGSCICQTSLNSTLKMGVFHFM